MQFDRYEEASEAVYKILLRYTAVVQPISCDEAYLEITGLGDPLAIAANIRAEVWPFLPFLPACLLFVSGVQIPWLRRCLLPANISWKPSNAGAGGAADRVHRQCRHWPEHAVGAAGDKACQAKWRVPHCCFGGGRRSGGAAAFRPSRRWLVSN